MNVDKLREELAADEGCKFEIYLDHLGLPTFGIGHLIREHDPEHGKPIGTEVSDERVRQVFALDVLVTVEDCHRLFNNWDDLPDEAQLVCANMAFNLGYPRFSKFINFRAAIEAQDWLKAADEAVDSRWHDQVPNRAKRLVQRLRGLANG
jgi:GH24 family phage-related lysozyme (muramidase)